MTYQIAICDDRPSDSRLVGALLRRWAERSGAAVEVEVFPSAEAFLFRYEENPGFDLLLLDIEMGGMDGVSLAKRLRETNEDIQIVFITGYSDYIAEGYEVAALHYLMKPVDEGKFQQVLDRAAGRLKRNEPALTLETHQETVRLPLSTIRFLEVAHNTVTVHAREDYSVKRPLGELEQELDGRFFRVSRSFLVNLQCVARVTRTEVELATGEKIPLPRRKYEELNRAIIERM